MAKARRATAARTRARAPRFLTIDIGGSGLKAAVIDRSGAMLTDRVRVKTPSKLTPKKLVDALAGLVAPLGPFDKVSVGFPGVVRDGVIITAPNLGTRALANLDLATVLTRRLKAPVRVANDAEIQGYAAISGRGVELVLTLGTGFGSALFLDGRSLSVLEMGHHPFRSGQTYEEQLGDKALKKVGVKHWNRRLRAALDTLHALFHYDRLYIGGGNAEHVGLRLGKDTTIIDNEMGVRGGAALWR